MTSEVRSTEEIILVAARKVFISKGLAAARMQEIADEAGINKALLHYYFRSKDQLFEAVFTQAVSSFLPTIKNILEADIPFRPKIILFVETYIELLLKNPHIPAFVIQELNTDPVRFVDKLKNFGINPEVLIRQITEEIGKGSIRPIRGDHFVVNLLALCIFPFVARPVVQGIFRKQDEEYDRFLQERKEEILQFIMKSIAVE